MIRKYPYHYTSDNVSKLHLQPFFEQVLPALADEINRTVVRHYSYKSRQPAEDDIFLIIERTWLGLLNNAILKSCPDSTTLQEFMVWGEDNKAKGRCDFLFSWNEYDILVESKLYEFKNDWKKCDNKSFYETDKMAKLRGVYYKEEQKYYANKTLGMVLVFEWIREKHDRLEKAKRLMDEWPDKHDDLTDFLVLYYGTSQGVFMYGKIEEFI